MAWNEAKNMTESHSAGLLPGEELVSQGLADLAVENLSESALLVLIAAPRLGRLGHKIPHKPTACPFEHRLYALLEQRLGAGAHSHYNALIRRICSYAHALERKLSQEERKADDVNPC